MKITPFSELGLLMKRRKVTIDEAATLLSGGRHAAAWVPAKEELVNAISSGRLNVIIDYSRFEQTEDRLRWIEMPDFLEFAQELREKVDQATSEPEPKPLPLVSIPISKQQDAAILEWLKGNNFEPLKLPKPLTGKAGVKCECRDALTANPKMFQSKNVFNTAWERLRNNKEIADCE